MYVYKSTFLKSAIGDGGYKNYDIQNQTLKEICDNYLDGYISLNHTILRGGFYLTIQQLRSNSIFADPTVTFKQWLTLNTDKALPITRNEPLYLTGEVKYSDAILAGFRLTAINSASIENPHLGPASERKDLLLEKNVTNKDLLYKRMLVTVNGFLHRTEPAQDGSGVKVIHGGETLNVSGKNTVGILSFERACDLKQVVLEEDMIQMAEGGASADKALIVDLNQDITNKTVIFSIGGYLVSGTSKIKVINAENGLVRIDTSKLRLIDMILDSVDKINLDHLTGWYTVGPDRKHSLNKMMVSTMINHSIIEQYMVLPQSFAIILDCDSFSEERMEVYPSGLPGCYEYHEEPQYPIITSRGRIPEYWKQYMEDWWVLRVSEDEVLNTFHSSNIERHNEMINSTREADRWYHDKPSFLKITTTRHTGEVKKENTTGVVVSVTKIPYAYNIYFASDAAGLKKIDRSKGGKGYLVIENTTSRRFVLEAKISTNKQEPTTISKEVRPGINVIGAVNFYATPGNVESIEKVIVNAKSVGDEAGLEVKDTFVFENTVPGLAVHDFNLVAYQEGQEIVSGRHGSLNTSGGVVGLVIENLSDVAYEVVINVTGSKSPVQDRKVRVNPGRNEIGNITLVSSKQYSVVTEEITITANSLGGKDGGIRRSVRVNNILEAKPYPTNFSINYVDAETNGRDISHARLGRKVWIAVDNNNTGREPITINVNTRDKTGRTVFSASNKLIGPGRNVLGFVTIGGVFDNDEIILTTDVKATNSGNLKTATLQGQIVPTIELYFATDTAGMNRVDSTTDVNGKVYLIAKGSNIQGQQEVVYRIENLSDNNFRTINNKQNIGNGLTVLDTINPTTVNVVLTDDLIKATANFNNEVYTSEFNYTTDDLDDWEVYFSSDRNGIERISNEVSTASSVYLVVENKNSTQPITIKNWYLRKNGETVEGVDGNNVVVPVGRQVIHVLRENKPEVSIRRDGDLSAYSANIVKAMSVRSDETNKEAEVNFRIPGRINKEDNQNNVQLFWSTNSAGTARIGGPLTSPGTAYLIANNQNTNHSVTINWSVGNDTNNNNVVLSPGLHVLKEVSTTQPEYSETRDPVPFEFTGDIVVQADDFGSSKTASSTVRWNLLARTNGQDDAGFAELVFALDREGTEVINTNNVITEETTVHVFAKSLNKTATNDAIWNMSNDTNSLNRVPSTLVTLSPGLNYLGYIAEFKPAITNTRMGDLVTYTVNLDVSKGQDKVSTLSFRIPGTDNYEDNQNIAEMYWAYDELGENRVGSDIRNPTTVYLIMESSNKTLSFYTNINVSLDGRPVESYNQKVIEPGVNVIHSVEITRPEWTDTRAGDRKVMNATASTLEEPVQMVYQIPGEYNRQDENNTYELFWTKDEAGTQKVTDLITESGEIFAFIKSLNRKLTFEVNGFVDNFTGADEGINGFVVQPGLNLLHRTTLIRPEVSALRIGDLESISVNIDDAPNIIGPRNSRIEYRIPGRTSAEANPNTYSLFWSSDEAGENRLPNSVITQPTTIYLIARSDNEVHTMTRTFVIEHNSKDGVKPNSNEVEQVVLQPGVNVIKSVTISREEITRRKNGDLYEYLATSSEYVDGVGIEYRIPGTTSNEANPNTVKFYWSKDDTGMVEFTGTITEPTVLHLFALSNNEVLPINVSVGTDIELPATGYNYEVNEHSFEATLQPGINKVGSVSIGEPVRTANRRGDDVTLGITHSGAFTVPETPVPVTIRIPGRTNDEDNQNIANVYWALDEAGLRKVNENAGDSHRQNDYSQTYYLVVENTNRDYPFDYTLNLPENNRNGLTVISNDGSLEPGKAVIASKTISRPTFGTTDNIVELLSVTGLSIEGVAHNSGQPTVASVNFAPMLNTAENRFEHEVWLTKGENGEKLGTTYGPVNPGNGEWFDVYLKNNNRDAPIYVNVSDERESNRIDFRFSGQPLIDGDVTNYTPVNAGSTNKVASFHARYELTDRDVVLNLNISDRWRHPISGEFISVPGASELLVGKEVSLLLDSYELEPEKVGADFEIYATTDIEGNNRITEVLPGNVNTKQEVYVWVTNKNTHYGISLYRSQYALGPVTLGSTVNNVATLETSDSNLSNRYILKPGETKLLDKLVLSRREKYIAVIGYAPDKYNSMLDNSGNPVWISNATISGQRKILTIPVRGPRHAVDLTSKVVKLANVNSTTNWNDLVAETTLVPDTDYIIVTKENYFEEFGSATWPAHAVNVKALNKTLMVNLVAGNWNGNNSGQYKQSSVFNFNLANGFNPYLLEGFNTPISNIETVLGSTINTLTLVNSAGENVENLTMQFTKPTIRVELEAGEERLDSISYMFIAENMSSTYPVKVILEGSIEGQSSLLFSEIVTLEHRSPFSKQNISVPKGADVSKLMFTVKTTVIDTWTTQATADIPKGIDLTKVSNDYEVYATTDIEGRNVVNSAIPGNPNENVTLHIWARSLNPTYSIIVEEVDFGAKHTDNRSTPVTETSQYDGSIYKRGYRLDPNETKRISELTLNRETKYSDWLVFDSYGHQGVVNPDNSVSWYEVDTNRLPRRSKTLEISITDPRYVTNLELKVVPENRVNATTDWNLLEATTVLRPDTNYVIVARDPDYETLGAGKWSGHNVTLNSYGYRVDRLGVTHLHGSRWGSHDRLQYAVSRPFSFSHQNGYNPYGEDSQPNSIISGIGSSRLSHKWIDGSGRTVPSLTMELPEPNISLSNAVVYDYVDNQTLRLTISNNDSKYPVFTSTNVDIGTNNVVNRRNNTISAVGNADVTLTKIGKGDSVQTVTYTVKVGGTNGWTKTLTARIPAGFPGEANYFAHDVVFIKEDYWTSKRTEVTSIPDLPLDTITSLEVHVTNKNPVNSILIKERTIDWPEGVTYRPLSGDKIGGMPSGRYYDIPPGRTIHVGDLNVRTTHDSKQVQMPFVSVVALKNEDGYWMPLDSKYTLNPERFTEFTSPKVLNVGGWENANDISWFIISDEDIYLSYVIYNIQGMEYSKTTFLNPGTNYHLIAYKRSVYSHDLENVNYEHLEVNLDSSIYALSESSFRNTDTLTDVGNEHVGVYGPFSVIYNVPDGTSDIEFNHETGLSFRNKDNGEVVRTNNNDILTINVKPELSLELKQVDNRDGTSTVTVNVINKSGFDIEVTMSMMGYGSDNEFPTIMAIIPASGFTETLIVKQVSSPQEFTVRMFSHDGYISEFATIRIPGTKPN